MQHACSCALWVEIIFELHNLSSESAQMFAH